MTKFLTTWIFNGLALAAAAALLGAGLEIGDRSEPTSERLITLGLVALVFTLVNMVVAPVVKTLSLPLIILTLGLALLVINALLLLLTEWISGQIDISFVVDGFWYAVLASIVISLVNGVLNLVFRK